MMAMPSCNLGDLLVANGTETVLFLPEVAQPPPPLESGFHLHIEAFFKIRLPGRIVRIGFCTDLRVPLNADGRSGEQSNHFHLPFLTLEDAGENPAVGSVIRKVFVFHPSARFVSMSSACPFPDRLEDGMIGSMKGRFTDHMTVIERPTPNHGIEFCNQLACGQIATFFDTFSDFAEKRLDALLRWSDEELRAFPAVVFAYRLPKEVKTLFDMRDDGFLC